MNRIFSALVRFGELLPGLSAEEPRTAGVDVLGGVAHQGDPASRHRQRDGGATCSRVTGQPSGGGHLANWSGTPPSHRGTQT